VLDGMMMEMIVASDVLDGTTTETIVASVVRVAKIATVEATTTIRRYRLAQHCTG
jgi:hypothetical protein